MLTFLSALSSKIKTMSVVPSSPYTELKIIVNTIGAILVHIVAQIYNENKTDYIICL